MTDSLRKGFKEHPVSQAIAFLSMSTVNAPCCLLTRNEFYRSINPKDKLKPVNSLSDNLMESKQRRGTVRLTKSKHQDYSGHMTNSWRIGLILRSPASSRTSVKRLSPADRVIK